MVGVPHGTPLFLPHESDEFRFIFRRGVKHCVPGIRLVTTLCTFAAAEVSDIVVYTERDISLAQPDNSYL